MAKHKHMKAQNCKIKNAFDEKDKLFKDAFDRFGWDGRGTSLDPYISKDVRKYKTREEYLKKYPETDE